MNAVNCGQYNQEISKIQQQYETEVIHEMKIKEKENELFLK